MQFDLQKMLKDAKELQSKMEEKRKEAESKTIIGESGGGMIKITGSGLGKVKKIEIDPTLINPDEKGMLEDLLVAAVNNLREKADDLAESQMPELPFDLPNIPGLNL